MIVAYSRFRWKSAWRRRSASSHVGGGRGGDGDGGGGGDDDDDNGGGDIAWEAGAGKRPEEWTAGGEREADNALASDESCSEGDGDGGGGG